MSTQFSSEELSLCSPYQSNMSECSNGTYSADTLIQDRVSDNNYFELSRPSLKCGDLHDFISPPPWDDVSLAEGDDEGYLDEEIMSFPSESSLTTSPSLQSLHLHNQQRVSSLYFGMQLAHYLSRPPKKLILSTTYSDRAHKFILLDQSGIVAWCPENNHVERVYLYPAYKHKLFLEIHFASKFNVYFVLTKKRVIITFNSLFEQLHSTSCLENSLLNISFLDTRSLLIGGGVNGVSFWNYNKKEYNKNQGSRVRSQKSMENYILCSSGLTRIPENKLIRKINICFERKWIFALSFYDVFVLSYEGTLIKSFLNLHKQTITDCLFNSHHSVLLTVSNDSTLTLWSECGFPIHTFTSGMKSNTAVLQHPLSPHLVLVATEKGIIKCYNLFTLEEEFTQHIMDNCIATLGNICITKQHMLFASSAQNIFLFDFNYFCEFWGILGNELQFLCFDKCEQKSDRFHALCIDGTIRVYSISESRPISLVLPPPDITFPSSSASVAYDRTSNLLFILIGPQEIWVYTTKTNPSCRLEVYSEDILRSIMCLVDPETADFIPTSLLPHSFIPFCTCITVLPSTVHIRSIDVTTTPSHTNLLMLGMKDGRILFITTDKNFCKQFEMQVSVGELKSIRVSENSSQLITQSVSVNGFVLKLWSLPCLELLHSVELHGTLIAFWKLNDILMTGFDDGSLSLYSLEGMGSSLGRGSIDTSGSERDSRFDKIINIHGLERLNLFCTSHKSGLVKIWDHHKNLIKVIALNASLGGIYFLNSSGDLLVSLNRHFHIIRQEHVLSSVSIIQGTDNKWGRFDTLEESRVFEDPNSRNGELTSTKNGLFYLDTMSSYLQPYDIDLHGPDGLTVLDQMLDQETKQSIHSFTINSSEFNTTPIASQLFLSPLQSPLVLSFENFPLPIFSTPTASPRSTSPSLVPDEREVLREKLINLVEKESQNLTSPFPTQVVDPVQELISKNNVQQYSDRDEGLDPKKQFQPATKIDLTKFNINLNYKFPLQTQAKKEEVIVSKTDNENTELELKVKPPSTVSKISTLRKRRTIIQDVSKKSMSTPSEDFVQAAISVQSVCVFPMPPTYPPTDNGDGSIHQVNLNIKTKSREANSKLSSTKIHDTIDNFTESGSKETVFNQSEQQSSQLDVLMERKLCIVPPLLENVEKVLKFKRNTKKIFTLNTYTDFSVGWQEREYIRRLAYRIKGNERNLKVWAHQAKLDTDRCMRRAKLVPDSRNHLRPHETIKILQLLKKICCKEGITQTRNSTPTTQMTTNYSSTSSFHAHKLQLDSQSGFRITNTSQESLESKDNFNQVPPNSRSSSAPFLRKSFSKIH